MSNDCFFEPDAPGCFCINNPDDPSCQEPEPEPKEPMEDDYEVGFFFGWPAQLAFTMAAAWGTAHAAIDLFRYNKGTDVENEWKAGDDVYTSLNWQKWGTLILQYGALSLWGWAAIIQLIANFGVLNSLNLLTWMVILPLGGLLVNLVGGIFLFIAYQQAWKESEKDAGDPSLWLAVREFALELIVGEAAITIGLMEFAEEWFWANVMRLPKEQRDKKMGKKEKKEKKMDHEEKYAVLASLYGF